MKKQEFLERYFQKSREFEGGEFTEDEVRNLALQLEESMLQEQLYYPNKEALAKLESLYRKGTHVMGEKLSLFYLRELRAELSGFFFLPFPWLMRQIEEADPVEQGAHSRISGDIRGELYLRFPAETGSKLIRLGMKSWGFRRVLFTKKIQESILTETMNLLINTFWATLQERIPIHWALTPPVPVASISKSLKLASKIYSSDHSVLWAEISVQPDLKMDLIFIPMENALSSFLLSL